MAININDNFSILASKPLDARLLKFVGGISTVYASVSEANAAITYRYRTLTVPILVGGIPIDHWYQQGTTDVDLVPKPAFSVNVTGFLKGVSGNIIGQAQINDGDISSIGWNKVMSTPTSLSGYGIVDAQTFITPTTSADYFRGDKTFQPLNKAAVGLPNVDNTSDVNKPISTAVQTALNSKQGTLSLTTTGTNVVATLVGSTLNIPTYDGSETKLTAGTDIVISGAGTIANPYIINSIAAGGGGGGAGVTSFNGRVGVVLPVANDYTFAQLASKPTTVAGYGITDAVPNSRTISINGTSLDLSANRSFTVGSVTTFSTGSLSPLFTASVANPSTTPALSFTLSTQTANTVFAGPTTGVASAPTFRALVAADIPALPQSAITNLVSDLASKQATLVSGTNIKTINGTSILGTGNIVISGGAGGTVTSFAFTNSTGITGTVTNSTTTPTLSLAITADALTDGTTNKAYTAAEKTKLAGIATGATANSSDATLLNRANHTGTQAESTITGLVSDLAAKQATLVSGTNIKTVNGASILGTGDLTVSASLTLTTTGTSGPATYSSGVLNIPQYSGVGGGSEVTLRTLAQLRAETAPSTSLRYQMTDIGMEGLWYYDSSDTTSTDNTGLILVSTNGKRFKRIYDGENVRVQWFGVKGDGTNETTGFQLALNNTAGKTLLVENITVRMGGTLGGAGSGAAWTIIFTGNNRKIIGRNGIIKYFTTGSQPDVFWYMNSITNLEISGIEMDLESLAGNETSGTNLLWFESCFHMIIKDNYIHDNGHAVMRFLGGNYIKVLNNTIRNTDSVIFFNRSAFGGNGASDVVVSGNIIEGGTSEAIGFFSHGDDAGMNARWVVSANVIKNKPGAFNVSRSKYGLIIGNTVVGCKAIAYYQDSGSGFAYNEFGTDIDFVGNTCIDGEFGVKNVSDRCSVIGNTFKNFKYTAVLTNGHLDSGSALHNVTVTGCHIKDNTFVNCSYLDQAFPIIELQDLVKSSVMNNTFSGSVNSSVKAFRCYNLDNVSIEGNNAWDAVYEWFSSDTASFSKRLIVKDNIFLDTNMDLSATSYPSSTFNWIFEQNRFLTLEASPTNSFFYPNVSSGAMDVNSRFPRDYYVIGTTNVTSIKPSYYGRQLTLVASGGVTFTHSSALALVGASNLTLSAGQSVTFVSLGSGNWKEKYRSLS